MMQKRVDLTLEFKGRDGSLTLTERHVPLQSAHTAYTGVCYRCDCDCMTGSYIDFPGHIQETDDGQRGDTANLADFYRMDAAVIHLNRESGSGGISGAELERAWGGVPQCKALIVNALGAKSPFDIAQRSVFLELDAIAWIQKTGCKLLVSDVYESTALEGVFLKLFEAGITAICEPANLAQVTAKKARLTVMFPKLAAKQIFCSMVAEFEDETC